MVPKQPLYVRQSQKSDSKYKPRDIKNQKTSKTSKEIQIVSYYVFTLFYEMHLHSLISLNTFAVNLVFFLLMFYGYSFTSIPQRVKDSELINLIYLCLDTQHTYINDIKQVINQFVYVV